MELSEYDIGMTSLKSNDRPTHGSLGSSLEPWNVGGKGRGKAIESLGFALVVPNIADEAAAVAWQP